MAKLSSGGFFEKKQHSYPWHNWDCHRICNRYLRRRRWNDSGAYADTSSRLYTGEYIPVFCMHHSSRLCSIHILRTTRKCSILADYSPLPAGKPDWRYPLGLLWTKNSCSVAAPHIGNYGTLGRISIFVYDNFIITVIIAAALGFLSGLGVGGGSLLLLWLTLIVGTDPSTARFINLLFFLPSAAATCWFRWKNGNLCIKQILPAICGGCLGAVLGSFAAGILPITVLRKGFGILLIATGIRELLYKPKNQAA